MAFCIFECESEAPNENTANWLRAKEKVWFKRSLVKRGKTVQKLMVALLTKGPDDSPVAKAQPLDDQSASTRSVSISAPQKKSKQVQEKRP